MYICTPLCEAKRVHTLRVSDREMGADEGGAHERSREGAKRRTRERGHSAEGANEKAALRSSRKKPPEGNWLKTDLAHWALRVITSICPLHTVGLIMDFFLYRALKQSPNTSFGSCLQDLKT